MAKYFRLKSLVSTPASGDQPATQGRYPVGPATIWRWVKAGKFPQPVRLGPQTTAWLVEDLDRWDAARTKGAAL